MFLPKDFYRLVEQPNYLKHILYGDSVSKDTQTLLCYENIPLTISFEKLWDTLSDKVSINIIDDKEYIFFKDVDIQFYTYDVKKDKQVFLNASYLMRHKFKGNLIRLKVNNDFLSLDITKNHSLIDYDNTDHQMIKLDPSQAKYITIPFLSDILIQYPYRYGKINKIISSDEEYDIALHNVIPCKIDSKEEIEYDGYVYDICIPETQIFLANGFFVHNTDSLFLTLPYPEKDKKYNNDEIRDIVENHSENINQLIIKYKEQYLLPKANIKPEHNKTSFKTEMILAACLFLHVKKNYAYKILMKEGNPVPEGKNIGFTNMQIKKSDSPELTKDILREIIINISLNEKLEKTEKMNKVVEAITNYQRIFNTYVDNFDFLTIGIPGKWAKKNQMINGMLIYNYIMNKKIFSFGSSGKFLYCTFDNISLFYNIPNIDKNNIKGICIPYKYISSEVQERFDKFGIKIDKKTQWDKIFSTTCENVIEVVKEACGEN